MNFDFVYKVFTFYDIEQCSIVFFFFFRFILCYLFVLMQSDKYIAMIWTNQWTFWYDNYDIIIMDNVLENTYLLYFIIMLGSYLTIA